MTQKPVFQEFVVGLQQVNTEESKREKITLQSSQLATDRVKDSATDSVVLPSPKNLISTPNFMIPGDGSTTPGSGRPSRRLSGKIGDLIGRLQGTKNSQSEKGV